MVLVLNAIPGVETDASRKPLEGGKVVVQEPAGYASVWFCHAEGLGFLGLFSDILQVGQRGARPEVDHEVGRLAILIDCEVVDGG